MALWLNSESWS